MGKKKLITVIDFLHKQLEENGVPVEKIILFGSQIKKTATNDSDIDVVIVSRKFRRKDLQKRLELLKNPVCATIEKYIVPLDVIPMTPEDLERRSSPVAAYARKGVVFFAA